jgi:hypothetical protein
LFKGLLLSHLHDSYPPSTFLQLQVAALRHMHRSLSGTSRLHSRCFPGNNSFGHGPTVVMDSGSHSILFKYPLN